MLYKRVGSFNIGFFYHKCIFLLFFINIFYTYIYVCIYIRDTRIYIYKYRTVHIKLFNSFCQKEMQTTNEEAVKSMQAMSGDVEATRKTLVMLPPRPVSPAEHGFVQLELAGPLASAPLRNFLFYIKYGLGV